MTGPRILILSTTDIARCPKGSLLPRHYRDDGSCRCDERKAALARVRELRVLLRAARDWLDAT